MSPRPYKLGRREAATGQTRERILAAAREALSDGDPTHFSVEAVARRADVARMTIYYQFNSRVGLLEAMFDDLAARGGMERLPIAFRQPRSLDALSTYITILSGFYGASRPLHRRLRGLAVLDPDLDRALSARNERRRTGLTVIVHRIGEEHGHPLPEAQAECVTIIHMLTSFETFDALAGEGQVEAAAPLVERLARGALGFPWTDR